MIRCADDTIYTGVTTDIRRRMGEHCSHTNTHAKYTRSHPVTELLALWTTDTRSQAQSLEYRIKKLTRTQKLALIETGEPFPLASHDGFVRIGGVTLCAALDGEYNDKNETGC